MRLLLNGTKSRPFSNDCECTTTIQVQQSTLVTAARRINCGSRLQQAWVWVVASENFISPKFMSKVENKGYGFPACLLGGCELLQQRAQTQRNKPRATGTAPEVSRKFAYTGWFPVYSLGTCASYLEKPSRDINLRHMVDNDKNFLIIWDLECAGCLPWGLQELWIVRACVTMLE